MGFVWFGGVVGLKGGRKMKRERGGSRVCTKCRDNNHFRACGDEFSKSFGKG